MTDQWGTWGPPQSPPVAQAPEQGRRRDWRITFMAAAVVLLMVAGGVVYVRGDTPSKTPRAHLESAILATNAAVTADLALDVKASFEGVTFAFTATGAVDFATDAASLQLSVLGERDSIVESNDTLYVSQGKPLGPAYPTKTWVRMPLSAMSSGGSASGSQALATADPQGLLRDLVKLGASITPTGSTTIDGNQDAGYRVRLNVGELEAHASELPPSIRSLFSTAKTVPKSARVETTMYTDPAGQLQAAHLVVAARQTGHRVTMSLDLTMSNFGAATVAAPPPATKTVTYQQLKGTAGSGAIPLASVDRAQGT